MSGVKSVGLSPARSRGGDGQVAVRAFAPANGSDPVPAHLHATERGLVGMDDDQSGEPIGRAVRGADGDSQTALAAGAIRQLRHLLSL